MHIDERPAAARQAAPERVDRALRTHVRDWFEQDLRRRIDAAMERRLASVLAVGTAVATELGRAA